MAVFPPPFRLSCGAAIVLLPVVESSTVALTIPWPLSSTGDRWRCDRTSEVIGPSESGGARSPTSFAQFLSLRHLMSLRRHERPRCSVNPLG